MAASAVVFAYHDVGVRCLSVLLAAGIRPALVVTHRDDPRETIWFASVEKLAREQDLEVATPDDPREVEPHLARIAPDFLFSFYYRHMLPAPILAAARRGAFNMHGSLLPKYRGRVPVNWAILRGERETGATLHEMVEKPDAGRLVDQMAVPILPDDVALDVFRKVTAASEIVLHRSLPALVAGTARLVPQDLAAGGYFGGRKPDDGRIDWTQPARRIHDLVRAVAPPYPGAFTAAGGRRLRILRTRVLSDADAPAAPALEARGDRVVARCGGGGTLLILDGVWGGEPLRAAQLGGRALPLGETP
ncbi:MAG TPA: formyltransferase [Usitatibacter sp.]|jgi:methionyl-tRNA formyltransferase|nr:formyltransferase [Usitatibacter sp.]